MYCRTPPPIIILAMVELHFIETYNYFGEFQRLPELFKFTHCDYYEFITLYTLV